MLPEGFVNNFSRLKLSFLHHWNRLLGYKKMDSPTGTEDLRQRIHELERDLSLAKTLNGAMQIDIETLQAQLNKNDQSFLEYKGKIETEISSKRSEEVNLLRTELDEQREMSEKIISDLKSKINELENKDLTVPSNDQDEFLKNKLFKVQDDNEILVNEINELKLLLKNEEEEISYLNTKFKTLEERYEETSEILESKKEALNQATEALREVQEEKALLSSELALIKDGPIDDKRRGNSLFAEVDDNRQHLKETIAKLKAKLNEFKVTLSAKQSENNRLVNENDRLRHKMQEMDRCWIKPEQLQLVEAYKTRIKELELIVDSSPKIELPKANADEYQRMKWAMDTLDKTRNELRALQSEFNKLSHQRILDCEELSSSRLEVKRLKTELSNQKMDYEVKLQKLRENNLCDNGYSENKCKENLNPNIVNGASEESVKLSKSVRFAEGQ